MVTNSEKITRFSRCVLRPWLGVFLRDIDGKTAGIPQCRTLGTTLWSDRRMCWWKTMGKGNDELLYRRMKDTSHYLIPLILNLPCVRVNTCIFIFIKYIKIKYCYHVLLYFYWNIFFFSNIGHSFNLLCCILPLTHLWHTSNLNKQPH